MDWLQTLVGGAIGGILATALNWLREETLQRTRRRYDQLAEQLKVLYGPLHVLTSKNALFSTQAAKVLEVARTEDRRIPLAAQVSDTTIAVANAYSAKVCENNQRIQDLLEKNWHLMDVDDLQLFLDFLLQRGRDEVEWEQKRIHSLPVSMKNALGPIVVLEPEFIKRVGEKWKKKQEDLNHLLAKWNRGEIG